MNFILSLFSELVFFSSFLKEQSSFPQPFSPEEEKEDLLKAKQGDKEAKEELIKHNLRLVVHIVKKYKDCGADSDDLISVGSIGLIKAVSTYESDKGTQLATYAARCIENEILMLLRSNKKFKANVSLTESVGTDKEGNEITLMDLLSVDDESVLKQVEISILTEKMLKIIKKILSKREYDIISLRYGVGGKPALTQRETAAILGISRSYVSRIEKKALSDIRKALKKENLYLD